MSYFKYLNFEKITYNSAKGRKLYRRAEDNLFETLSLKRRVSYSAFEKDGMNYLWTEPIAQVKENLVVLYCHGGGFNAGGMGYMKLLSGKFADTLACPVLSYEYGLSPENQFPVALDDTYRAWKYLLSLGYSAGKIIVAGDSAGGNLALELCLKLKRNNKNMPSRLILLSPWTDMSMKGKSYVKYDGKDPVISKRYIMASRQMYAPDADYTDKKLSPIYGDMHGFPDTLIQVGEIELLRSDSERLYKKLISSNVNAKLQVYSRVWHVFQQMPLKKSRIAFDNIYKFVKGESDI